MKQDEDVILGYPSRSDGICPGSDRHCEEGVSPTKQSQPCDRDCFGVATPRNDDATSSGDTGQLAARGQTSDREASLWEESPTPAGEILRFAQDDKRRTQPTGLARIASAFAAARAEGRAALMPYFTLGYPDIAAFEAVVRAIAAAGADLIELGVPFSDPLADGPTIQHSTQVALEQGMTLAHGLALTHRLRAAGVTQPLLLMGYVNPILAYGVSRYVKDAAVAGADGFIVPDLPPEEAGELEAACRVHGLALVFLLAPTSTPERIAAVVSHTTGFVYLVSLAGVTGARDQLPPDLAAFVGRVRAATGLPLAVGFGIATPEHASAVGALADGVIVGSALIKAVGAAADPAAAAGRFVRALREALRRATNTSARL
jgi:tryptophan synthase alpha chain